MTDIEKMIAYINACPNDNAAWLAYVDLLLDAGKVTEADIVRNSIEERMTAPGSAIGVKVRVVDLYDGPWDGVIVDARDVHLPIKVDRLYMVEAFSPPMMDDDGRPVIQCKQRQVVAGNRLSLTI